MVSARMTEKASAQRLQAVYRTLGLISPGVDLESELGVGSKFSLTLPLRYQPESKARNGDETTAGLSEV